MFSFISIVFVVVVIYFKRKLIFFLKRFEKIEKRIYQNYVLLVISIEQFYFVTEIPKESTYLPLFIEQNTLLEGLAYKIKRNSAGYLDCLILNLLLNEHYMNFKSLWWRIRLSLLLIRYLFPVYHSDRYQLNC